MAAAYDYPVCSHALAAHLARQEPGMYVVYRLSHGSTDGYRVIVRVAGGEAERSYVPDLNRF